MMKQAVLYARVAVDDQPKSSRNLHQLETCREYAREHGYQIVAELSEVGSGAGGRSLERPQLNRVREMAQAGEFDILIVHKSDRLSRSLPEYLIIEEELRDNGVHVEYVLEGYPLRRAAIYARVNSESQLM
jgi:site-specific DNA recombinase